jgi:hypothetical protein
LIFRTQVLACNVPRISKLLVIFVSTFRTRDQLMAEMSQIQNWRTVFILNPLHQSLFNQQHNVFVQIILDSWSPWDVVESDRNVEVVFIKTENCGISNDISDIIRGVESM